MKIGDHVILTGDNFQVPRVGLRGIVTEISPAGYVKVEWSDDLQGWFAPYQSSRWLAKVMPSGQ